MRQINTGKTTSKAFCHSFHSYSLASHNPYVCVLSRHLVPSAQSNSSVTDLLIQCYFEKRPYTFLHLKPVSLDLELLLTRGEKLEQLIAMLLQVQPHLLESLLELSQAPLHSYGIRGHILTSEVLLSKKQSPSQGCPASKLSSSPNFFQSNRSLDGVAWV